MTIEVETKRKWSAIKTKFSFMELVSFREDRNFLGEIKSITGSFKLDRLPTTDDAITIRKELGLKKKPSLTNEEREARRTQLSLNLHYHPVQEMAEIA